jgi:hypothetical protein
MRLRLDLVHQATSLVRFDEYSDPWFSQGVPQFLQMFRTGQERESTVFPGVVDGSGIARRRDQGRHQDVSIEHHTH